MPILTVTKKGPDLFGFNLNQPDNSVKRLRFSKAGISKSTLATKGVYILDWVVRGRKGTAFSYKVELDDKITEELKDAKVSAQGWDTGSIDIEVKR